MNELICLCWALPRAVGTSPQLSDVGKVGRVLWGRFNQQTSAAWAIISGEPKKTNKKNLKHGRFIPPHLVYQYLWGFCRISQDHFFLFSPTGGFIFRGGAGSPKTDVHFWDVWETKHVALRRLPDGRKTFI